jgi:hypothetical protein
MRKEEMDKELNETREELNILILKCRGCNKEYGGMSGP